MILAGFFNLFLALLLAASDPPALILIPGEVTLDVSSQPPLFSADLDSQVEAEVPVRIDVLAADDSILFTQTTRQPISRGRSTLQAPLEGFRWKELNEREFVWLRCRVRMDLPHGQSVSRIFSFSEILRGFFDLEVTAPEAVSPSLPVVVWVRSYTPVTARPVSGVSLQASLSDASPGESLRLEAVTDGDGLATFEFPARPWKTDPVLRIQGKRGVVERTVENDLELERALDLVLQTDRLLYQPGQTVFARALAFDRSRRALENKPLRFKVSDEDGRVFEVIHVTTAKYGVASFEWKIPDGANDGYYSIGVGEDFGPRDPQQWEWIRVTQYELPEFRISARPDHPYYLPGTDARVTVRAAYQSGKPVYPGTVRLIRKETEWDSNLRRQVVVFEKEWTGSADANGAAEFAIDLEAEFQHFLSETDETTQTQYIESPYSFEVTDGLTGKKEEGSFTVRLSRNKIHVYSSLRAVNLQLPEKAYLKTYYADGAPASCQITLKPGWLSQVFSTTTDRFGLGVIELPAASEVMARGPGMLEVEARDASGQSGRITQEPLLHRDLAVDVGTDRSLYFPGESVSMSIASTFSDVPGFYYLSQEGIVKQTGPFRLDKAGRAELRLDQTEGLEGKVGCCVALPWTGYRLLHAQNSCRTVLFTSDNVLETRVSAPQESYRPGENVELLMELGLRDRVTEGLFGVQVVDEALLQLEEPLRQKIAEMQVAGFTLEDLMNSAPSPLDPSIDLAARMLLDGEYQYYWPSVRSRRNWYPDTASVFAKQVRGQVSRSDLFAALSRFVKRTGSFPEGDPAMKRALLEEGFDFDTLRDPWGEPFRVKLLPETREIELVTFEDRRKFREPVKRVEKVTRTRVPIGTIVLYSSGPDRRPATEDDFEGHRISISLVPNPPPILEADTDGPSGLSDSKHQPEGAIGGRVMDTTGASIPGATLSLQSEVDGSTVQGKSDDEGFFHFAGLPPGHYSLQAWLPGFRTSVTTLIPVFPQQTSYLDVELEIGEISETVQVSAGASELNSMTMNAELSATGMHGFSDDDLDSAFAQGTSEVRVRDFFPETLVWEPALFSDPQGQARISFQMPGSITSWRVRVTASTRDGRLAAAEHSLRSFQPFFVDYNPPVVLTEGDEISIPAIVRNYTESDQTVMVQAVGNQHLEIKGSGRQEVVVPGGRAEKTGFRILANRFGADIPSQILALSASERDAVEKRLEIRPNGKPVSFSLSSFIRGRLDESIEIPLDALNGTLEGEVKIYLDPYSHVADAVEGLLQRPYGCAEQTISSTYPNLLLLQYLGERPETYSPLLMEAHQNLKRGVQRLLSNRGEDGGFGYWGPREPDLALTAYALRFLSAASTVIPVEEEMLMETAAWLLEQQTKKGYWSRGRSRWSRGRNREKVSPDYEVSADIARVLAVLAGRTEDEKVKRVFRNQAGKALDACRAADSNNSYQLAMRALAAFELGSTDEGLKLVERLSETARASNTPYWEPSGPTPFWGWGRAGRLETTGLVLLALLAAQSQRSDPELDSAIDRSLAYLMDEKDSFGVWYSTSATIRVLEALVAAADRLSLPRKGYGPIEIKINGRLAATIDPLTIGEWRKPVAVPLRGFLAPGGNRIQVHSRAGAPLTVLLSGRYYRPWRAAESGNSGLQMDVDFDRLHLQNGEEVECRVVISRQDPGWSSMLLVEVGLPPGAAVSRREIEQLPQVSRLEILPDRVRLYVWSTKDPKPLVFHFKLRMAMTARSAPSRIFDFYNPDQEAFTPPVLFTVEEPR